MIVHLTTINRNLATLTPIMLDEVHRMLWVRNEAEQWMTKTTPTTTMRLTAKKGDMEAAG